jgi:flavin-dependent dehydrogenase
MTSTVWIDVRRDRNRDRKMAFCAFPAGRMYLQGGGRHDGRLASRHAHRQDRARIVPIARASIVEEQFKKLGDQPSGGGASGAGAQTSYAGFQRLDAAWRDMKTRTIHGMPPKTVRTTNDPLPATPGIDVLIAGGTLGIFLAMALQKRGLRTVLLERGNVAGRDQDWNVSREELLSYVKAGVLSEEQAEACVTIEFNPIRAGFYGYPDISTNDVLNLGVSPRKLIAAVVQNYTAAGGLVLEESALENVWVHPNGVEVRFRECGNVGMGSDGNAEERDSPQLALASKLFIDSMGNASPIVRQIRHGKKPDGVCMVVGSCCRGFDEGANTSGDIIRTIDPSDTDINIQLFWEAFPAGSGPRDRTTYMFSYMDADKCRPSFDDFMAMYWEKMPGYQNVSLDDLQVQRILYGLFPTYNDAPLPPQWDRIIQIGDAGGLQSPLSFGGFTALARHIGRLAGAITDAVQSDCLDRYELKFINPYSPSLSSAWMFQKSMSIGANKIRPNPTFINRLLGGNFEIMAKDETALKPFLQDVIMAKELTFTLVNVMKSDPLFVPAIISTVGLPSLVDWVGHYVMLCVYTGITSVTKKHQIRERVEFLGDGNAKLRYVLRRALERWEYGSGLDYIHEGTQNRTEQ